jgi:Heavy-metal-associated domain.
MSDTGKKLILEGLCCEKCAAKIEADVRALSGVKSATVDPKSTILSIELLPGANYDSLDGEIRKIVAERDSDVVIREA